MYLPVLNLIINLTSQLEYRTKIGKFFRLLFRLTINGTVTSGHPTRTTFGNTLRVILYYEFIFYELGITNFSMFVGGDDFYCILTERDAKMLHNHIHKYFSKDGIGFHGLGQSTRKLHMLGDKIDFLSKLGYVKPGGVYLWRNFSRIAHK